MFSVAKRGFAAGTGRAKYVQVDEDYDPATAPRCAKCGVDYSPRRAATGRKCCLDCGEPPKPYVMVPTHKGPGDVLTNTDQLLTVYGDKSSATGIK